MTFQHRRLITAAEVTERHHGRNVTIGAVTGVLVGSMSMTERVDLVLIVGGSRAVFALVPGAEVEIGARG